MSTRYLRIRVGEHLGFHLKIKSSAKDRIMSCDICANFKFNVNLLKIIKKCNSTIILKLKFTKLY